MSEQVCGSAPAFSSAHAVASLPSELDTKLNMCVKLFAGLLRAPRVFGPRAGIMIQQKASYIHGKPPKNNVGAAESVFVLTVMTLAVLGPSGWVLANLDNYKSRD